MDLNRDIHPLTDFPGKPPVVSAHPAQTDRPARRAETPSTAKTNSSCRMLPRIKKLLGLAERLETIQAVREELASMEQGRRQANG